MVSRHTNLVLDGFLLGALDLSRISQCISFVHSYSSVLADSTRAGDFLFPVQTVDCGLDLLYSRSCQTFLDRQVSRVVTTHHDKTDM